MTHRPLSTAECLPSADYGGRAPLRRCAHCGFLWREAGDCPACGDDEILPASTGTPHPGAAGVSGGPSPLPSSGVSSLRLPAAADLAPAAGFFQGRWSMNNPVVYATRYLLAAGIGEAMLDWAALRREAEACEAPATDEAA